MAEQFITDVAKLSKDTQSTLAANAKSSGMTVEEYLTERGGVNPITKKYGDSYNPNTDLNDAEYQAAIAGKAGTEAGKALNAARDKKLKAYLAANPNSVEAQEARLAAGTQDAYGEGTLGKSSSQKTVSSVTKQANGSSIVTYSDGTTTVLPSGSAVPTVGSLATKTTTQEGQEERQSAYDLLYSQFKLYGLESLVEPLKGLITSGASPAEFTIKLRDSDAYKLRFAANAKRIANGFAAIDEATYLGLEDKFQSIMQNYGLPESYYKKGALGVQEKFEDLIAKNVDPVTLEERVMEGVKINQGSKLLIDTAKQFYPSLTDGDFLAYALDPKNALSEIRRKVTASEIGSAQIGAGLAATVGGAEELAKGGVTGKQYQQAAPTIAEAALRGGQLSSFYKQDPYTQQTAEALLLDVPGSAEALKKTKKLTSLESASFSGAAGAGAIARDRAGVL
jgi:hypothetical protein